MRPQSQPPSKISDSLLTKCLAKRLTFPDVIPDTMRSVATRNPFLVCHVAPKSKKGLPAASGGSPCGPSATPMFAPASCLRGPGPAFGPPRNDERTLSFGRRPRGRVLLGGEQRVQVFFVERQLVARAARSEERRVGRECRPGW